MKTTTAARIATDSLRIDSSERPSGTVGFDSDSVDVRLPDGRSVCICTITDDNGDTHSTVYVHHANADIAIVVTLHRDGIIDAHIGTNVEVN